MTQPTVLELAQNGDPQAIATLMNRTLHAQGMNARVARQGDRLMVMTEAEQVPNRMLMTNFVRNGINGLNLNNSIQIVRILGKKKGAEQPAWVQEIELSAANAATALEADIDDEPETAAMSEHTETAVSDPPAMRPVPPPPPMGRMQAEPGSSNAPTPINEPVTAHSTPPAPPPRMVPPPPPPPSMGSLDDDLDDLDEDDIYRDSTIMPNLDSEFPSSGFNEPLAEEEDISFDLQSVGDSVDSVPPLDERQGDRSLLDDEPISLDLDEDEALIDVPDDVLHQIIRQNGNGNVSTVTATPDDLYGDFDSDDDDNDEAGNAALPSGVGNEDETGDRAELAELPDANPPLLAESEPPAPAALPNRTDDEPEENARSGGLSATPIFVTVFVILVAWIAGILGYSVWQTANTPEIDPTAVTIPDNENTDVPTEPPADSSPDNPDNAYDTAVELANRADGLMANAQSQDDWTLAVTQWQQVIGLLEQVPEDNPNYESAQTALANAQQALGIAQAGADQPPASNTLPTTTVRIAGGEVCEGVRSTQESPPVELTNVQLDDPASPNSVTYFVGCITNHTNQVIDNVQISYTTGADATAQGSLNFRNLAPGQTIPFSSNFTLSPGTIEVTITNITWNATGVAEPQTLNTSLLVSQSTDG